MAWLPQFEANVTYRGPADSEIDASAFLAEACRQSFEQAQLPLDQEPLKTASLGPLRSGIQLGCRAMPYAEQAKTSGDASSVVSHTIPSSMTCGDSIPVSITMGNIGSTTWAFNSCYRLGSYGGYDPFFDTNVRHNLPVMNVAPGDHVTFNFTLDAPASAGTYVTDWQMIAAGHCGGGGWFGAVASQTVDVNCGNDAEVASHTLPSQMYCGQVRTEQVTMKNTGSTTWTSADGYQLTFVDGTDPLIWYGSMALPTNASIAPGQTHTFNLTYRPADALSGTFVTDFEMRDWPTSFGEQASANVNVTCNTSAEMGWVRPSDGVDPVVSGDAIFQSHDASSDSVIHLTLKNNGTDPMLISNSASAWTGNPAIEVVDGIPPVIGPGQEDDIILRLDEDFTANDTYTGTLSMDLNSRTQPFEVFIIFYTY